MNKVREELRTISTKELISKSLLNENNIDYVREVITRTAETKGANEEVCEKICDIILKSTLRMIRGCSPNQGWCVFRYITSCVDKVLPVATTAVNKERGKNNLSEIENILHAIETNEAEDVKLNALLFGPYRELLRLEKKTMAVMQVFFDFQYWETVREHPSLKSLALLSACLGYDEPPIRVDNDRLDSTLKLLTFMVYNKVSQ